MTTYSAITSGQVDAESVIDTTLAGQWASNVLGIIEGDATASGARIAGDKAMTAITAGSTYDHHASPYNAEVTTSTGTLQNASTITSQFGRILSFIIQRKGTYRCSWEAYRSAGTGACKTRIYKNNAAFGTDTASIDASYTTKTDDLTFAAGDRVDLYINSADTFTGLRVRNFKIQATQPPFG